MGLKIYNVLSRKKEDFIPIEEGKVKMYACGITASGKAHIGHAYQALVFDTIRKYLEYKGFSVTYVRNYTDVDDKIIIKSRELGINPMKYAEDMISSIEEDMNRLHVDKPTIQSRATESMDYIINFIQRLIDNGNAYSNEYGDVYFRVSSFNDYGKLSNRLIDNSINGVRKSIEPGKEDERDFALWKNAKDDEIYWDSPWGKGRPGWHIECSAMSMRYLGEQIDIHGGGKDLIFPHHENEIAQTESLTGKNFSNYWIHNGLIKINGEKMSKSLGNSIYLSDLLDKYNYEVIKLGLLKNSYRSDMNIVDGDFDNYEKLLYKLYSLFNEISEYQGNNEYVVIEEIKEEIKDEFIEAMDNDFNTSVVIANLYNYLNQMNVYVQQKKYAEAISMKDALIEVYSVIGFLKQDSNDYINEIKDKYLEANEINQNIVEDLIELRNKYKLEKNYIKADEIRNELLLKNIALKDTREGTNWDINI